MPAPSLTSPEDPTPLSGAFPIILALPSLALGLRVQAWWVMAPPPVLPPDQQGSLAHPLAVVPGLLPP